MPFDSAALERSVLAYIRRHELLRAGDRLAVAISGGADSVALLRLMLKLRGELGIVLSAAHFNHKIRAEAAESDEQFVRSLAEESGIELYVSSGHTPAHAEQSKLSLEAAARQLRYSYLESLVRDGAVNKIATAHTLDDQAETVLMRVLRGTGNTGLRGIRREMPILDQEDKPVGSVIRPLLRVYHDDLVAYLIQIGQSWCEDATNADAKFTRNRVRHVLMPLLQQDFNPEVKLRLADLADISEADTDFIDSLASAQANQIIVPWPSGSYGSSIPDSPLNRARERDCRMAMTEHIRITLEKWEDLPLAVKRFAVREAAYQTGSPVQFHHIDKVVELADLPGLGLTSVDLPNGARVSRKVEYDDRNRYVGHYLVFMREPARSPEGYSYTFSIPGEIDIPDLNIVLEARCITPLDPNEDAGQFLDPGKLQPQLTVRNWRPGDQFWPAHTSGPKKVKELLQKRHVTGQERTLWPVVTSGAEIIWMRGFPVSEKHRITENASTGLSLLERQ